MFDSSLFSFFLHFLNREAHGASISSYIYFLEYIYIYVYVCVCMYGICVYVIYVGI